MRAAGQVFAPAFIRILQETGAVRRYGLALLCGVLATLTLPPFHLFPLLLPAYSGLVLLVVTAKAGRNAFATGWWFGMGYFVPGLYWFAHALLVEADKFAWMIPFAVLGLPAIISLYYAVGSWLFWRMPLKQPIARVISFSLIWLGIELLRGFLFTGFPWNLAAYGWSFSTVMIQPAALLGAYGYSAWTVLLAALPAVWFWPWDNSQRQIHTALLMVLAMLLLPFAYGYGRLQTEETGYTDTHLRIVQANIAQAHKWDPQKQKAIIDKHIGLSIPAQGENPPDIIIWPEAAYPFVVEAESPPLRYVMDALPPQSRLITGGMRAAAREQGGFDLWNSLSVVNNSARVLAYYDKHRLVPFGEFIPLRGFIPMEKKITHGIQDFARGSGVSIVESEGHPSFLPLICYEAIFPELAAHPQQRPGWLLNLTNDAWFGESSGPYQHLQMARMRAVEQGVPLVRAANTGVSIVTDSYGRIVARLPLLQEGVIRQRLPETAEATLYSRFEMAKVLTFYALLMVVLLWFFVNKFKIN